MSLHGLHEWSFAYNRRKRALGFCFYEPRRIELSIHFVEHNSLEAIRDTLLHEIAHALVGPGHGHDAVWKCQCLRIGASAGNVLPQRRHAAGAVASLVSRLRTPLHAPPATQTAAGVVLPSLWTRAGQPGVATRLGQACPFHSLLSLGTGTTITRMIPPGFVAKGNPAYASPNQHRGSRPSFQQRRRRCLGPGRPLPRRRRSRRSTATWRAALQSARAFEAAYRGKIDCRRRPRPQLLAARPCRNWKACPSRWTAGRLSRACSTPPRPTTHATAPCWPEPANSAPPSTST